jgi:probable HAF family extracellular repeat protein
MSDGRSMQRRRYVALSDVGKPSRLLDRGLARLERDGTSLSPARLSWTLHILWDPRWLAKIDPPPHDPNPNLYHEITCQDVAFDESGIVRGVIRLNGGVTWKDDEGDTCGSEFPIAFHSFEWDLATGNRTLSDGEPEFAASSEPADSWTGQDSERHVWEIVENLELSVSETQIEGVSVGQYYDEKPIRNVRGSKASAGVVEDGIVTRLPSLGGYNDSATGINAARDIVGYSHTPDETMKAVRWRDGRITELPNPFIDSEASHINDDGLIIGWGDNGWGDNARPPGEIYSENRRGLVWRGQDLVAVLPGVPVALNEAGLVAGTEQAGEKQRAFVWWNGTTTFLPLSESFKGSGVAAMNERGDVAGWVKTKTRHRDTFPSEVPCVWLRIP